jgi:hypothetical protein
MLNPSSFLVILLVPKANFYIPDQSSNDLRLDNKYT